MRRALLWRSLFVLSVLFHSLLGVSAFAQAPSSDDSDDPDAKQPTSLNVNIVFSNEGKAQVNFYTSVQPDQSSGASEIKSVLESSLGCTLRDNSRVPNLY